MILKSKLGIIIFSLFILLCSRSVIAQDDFEDIKLQLEELSKDYPALNKKVKISVSNVEIQEFVRGIAKSSGVNINIDPTLDIIVINNFNDAAVSDILLFVCKEYGLEISIIGNIINLHKGDEIVLKEEHVKYDSINEIITFDFHNYSLIYAAREITRATGKNVILGYGLDNYNVSGYIQEMPFDGALEKFFKSNNLTIEITDDKFYIVNKPKVAKAAKSNVKNQPSITDLPDFTPAKYNAKISAKSVENISIYAESAPIYGLVKEISDRLNINYIFLSPLEGEISLNFESISYEAFLLKVFRGSEYGFVYENGDYLIGELNTIELSGSKVIKLQYRSIDKVIEYIPKNLISDLMVIEFPDQNSLIVEGPDSKIAALECFISDIDKIVPVVLIEVIIADISKTYTITSGINAGIGDAPIDTKGQLFPGIDLSIGTEKLNNILRSFDGFGTANLGYVTPDFYLLIKMLEKQDVLEIHSTPKLATINGSEATLSLGNTEYYLEEQVNLQGSVTTTSIKSQTYKAVDANLTITITPFVSGDEQITLEIIVDQKDFTERISNTAPPGTVNRSFQSVITVNNQEMILIGGLEEKRVDDSATGTPFLARIPVIKWFFSSRTNKKNNAKLSLFIRPTIIH